MLPVPPALIHPHPERPMTHHAEGAFEVKLTPLTEGNTDWGALGRFGLDKRFSGDLEATSRGQMLSCGDPKGGSAGYVAIEVLTGSLGGRRGGFALQHSGTMQDGRSDMVITVVPGSGTGELKGLAGTFRILLEGGKHRYAFDYTLPE